MSNDLISRSSLLEQYGLKNAKKYGNKDEEQQVKSCDTMMMYEIADMIRDAPTAYDVEKVVEQIESIMNDESIRFCDQAVREAVNIVKSGGVNE